MIPVCHIRQYAVFLSALLVILFSSCSKNSNREQEKLERRDSLEQEMDTIMEKIDSVTDTIGEKIKDVNQGVKEGLDEMKEKIPPDSTGLYYKSP